MSSQVNFDCTNFNNYIRASEHRCFICDKTVIFEEEFTLKVLVVMEKSRLKGEPFSFDVVKKLSDDMNIDKLISYRLPYIEPIKKRNIIKERYRMVCEKTNLFLACYECINKWGMINLHESLSPEKDLASLMNFGLFYDMNLKDQIEKIAQRELQEEEIKRNS